MGSHDSRNVSSHQWNSTNSSAGGVDYSYSIMGKQSSGEEEDTSRTSETGALSLGTGSPRAMTPDIDGNDHSLPLSRFPTSSTPIMGTPSTVSTAPSTDDASMMTDYKLEDSMLPHLLHSSSQSSGGHRRVSSWGSDGGPGRSAGLSLGMRFDHHQHQQLPAGQHRGGSVGAGPFSSQGTIQMQQPWNVVTQQHRVASFRGAPSAQESNLTQQHTPPPHQHQQQPHPHHQQAFNTHPSYSPAYLNLQRKAGYPPQQPQPHTSGVMHGAHASSSPASTPPRGPRAAPPRQPGQHQGHGSSNRQVTSSGTPSSSAHQSSPNPQRSPSEVLKTLLRKKACLYEPDTSRSVALTTWLVGRELALEYGFFSRQQLQSGVHACVARKIDEGIITRTKVNRCMQIILNSCFHYIIPRSDGSEEKGDRFRDIFSQAARNDKELLGDLPAPWNDLKVEKEVVIKASLEDDGDDHGATPSRGAPKKASSFSTPKNSPKIAGTNPDKSPGKESSSDCDHGDSKRAVLLCFNENVRSAEDVFRCHNEFIRDTANASHLQLTAQEWQTFFGRDAASASHLWGNVGIPVIHPDPRGGAQKQPDILGQMSPDEANKFRTTWCTKRYDHDHELCGFAHVEISGGWLRRNPGEHNYSDEMCGFISTTGDKRIAPHFFDMNECPDGLNCKKAHSYEEIAYHPHRYKIKPCTLPHGRSGVCHLGDVCPNLHPIDSTRHGKRSSDGRSHHGHRHGRKDQHHGASSKSQNVLPPAGSPIVYASPAPLSSFERQLAMPGLQNLYRRHCSVIRAHVRTAGKCKCCYSYFGDDSGVFSSMPPVTQKPRLGLPPSRRV